MIGEEQSFYWGQAWKQSSFSFTLPLTHISSHTLTQQLFSSTTVPMRQDQIGRIIFTLFIATNDSTILTYYSNFTYLYMNST